MGRQRKSQRGSYLVDGRPMYILPDRRTVTRWYGRWQDEAGKWHYQSLGEQDPRVRYPRIETQETPEFDDTPQHWLVDDIRMSVQLQMRCCNRPDHSCKRCFPAPGVKVRGHGPYWYGAYWQDGKRKRKYIGTSLPPLTGEGQEGGVA